MLMNVCEHKNKKTDKETEKVIMPTEIDDQLAGHFQSAESVK